ncbi:class I SAM-dependent methyltransferase [Nonomuraea sp. CA-141351]|uniref:class I SAM-dependent methyltransferase n=1 Tax=Nonomuraea sp. CA-141351 TaxID=3239996 RepID=UPI003D92A992
MAAAARAAHLIVDDEPRIFADTLAQPLLAGRADEAIGYHRASGDHPILAGARAAAVTRSRYAEDRLAESAPDQYVILGAGLDSFAYRAEKTRVFEVDHPATSRWKRELLAEAGIPLPGTVSFVAVDLENEPLTEQLVAGGFDPSRRAFVSWLGVSMYLTREAIGRTLGLFTTLAPGTELVLDYLVPEELRDEAGRQYAQAIAGAAAQGGEPWVSFFSPEEMAALLGAYGFEVVEQVSQRDSVDPALWDRGDALHPSGLAFFAHAKVRSPGR